MSISVLQMDPLNSNLKYAFQFKLEMYFLQHFKRTQLMQHTYILKQYPHTLKFAVHYHSKSNTLLLNLGMAFQTRVSCCSQ